ncbi:ArsR/SmtB family transcription factor [Stackebrandtia nassauensis]|uniref:Transcriptional regulator, ArsR family n=1 Tax=Stackebrandtia nassauensis (strain DSM 44728 / CIP 108903 / NRRL B-16338 / NBRC 102104 / LLR-40K-21) TaxID=446470 RepID=D3PXF7_STANL|nr:metalloregulator ArsR/SmtB family transcription factor [Stackebrandtia nassauensis]ADD41420.1 transcriptional regulator, ArsR family [Stackebrandtia nassauensis DSM 44728]
MADPTLTAPIPVSCCAPLAETALDDERAVGLSAMFKALGDPVRLRLLSLITSAPDEICVCDLTGAFDLTGATISHHLKVLRTAGLVDCERRGTWVYYWPLRDNLRKLSALLDSPVG